MQQYAYVYLLQSYSTWFFLYLQDVTRVTDQTSGECSLGQTIPI